MTRVLTASTVFVCLLASSAPAGPLWGAQTSCSIADIFPSNGQSNATVQFDGGAGSPLSAADIDDATALDSHGAGPWNRGRARASATLNPVPNNPPTLRAESRLTGLNSGQFDFGDFPNGATAFATAFATDVFQYTGNNPTTLTLTYTLDVNIGNTPSDTTFQTFAFAQLAVFDTAGYSYYPDLSTLIFELGAHLLTAGGVDARDDVHTSGDTGGSSTSLTLHVDFDVVPGQVFHVFTKMGTGAARLDRYADAYNTFSGSFSEPSNVVSLSVPTPGAAALGLLAVGFMLRKRG